MSRRWILIDFSGELFIWFVMILLEVQNLIDIIKTDIKGKTTTVVGNMKRKRKNWKRGGKNTIKYANQLSFIRAWVKKLLCTLTEKGKHEERKYFLFIVFFFCFFSLKYFLFFFLFMYCQQLSWLYCAYIFLLSIFMALSMISHRNFVLRMAWMIKTATDLMLMLFIALIS